MIINCGCKICNANLGEFLNEDIQSGTTPKQAQKNLLDRGLKVDIKTVMRHLSAFEITPKPQEIPQRQLTKVNMKNFDFSKYEFEETNPIAIVGYLQKLFLKVTLNQSELLLRSQSEALEGLIVGVPEEEMRNLERAYKLLDSVTGFSLYSNQQTAIKIVESMGLLNLNRPQGYIDVDIEQTDSQTEE
jgi:hypothetical protein